MNKKSRNRLIVITVIVLVLIAVLMYRSSIGSYSYYKTVNEVKSDKSLVGVPVRVSGKVVKGTVKKNPDGYRFEITDKKANMIINYDGVLPQTFAVGITVVAEGTLKSNLELEANKIITKCPTKYKSKTENDKGK
ncbi:MAG: cytochrome c maturation protein CcmE [Actinobacteria bacterium]|nr:cytochrome c maturation protein CcmE [Actinomycetota bacterium]